MQWLGAVLITSIELPEDPRQSVVRPDLESLVFWGLAPGRFDHIWSGLGTRLVQPDDINRKKSVYASDPIPTGQRADTYACMIGWFLNTREGRGNHPPAPNFVSRLYLSFTLRCGGSARAKIWVPDPLISDHKISTPLGITRQSDAGPKENLSALPSAHRRLGGSLCGPEHMCILPLTATNMPGCEVNIIWEVLSSRSR